VFLLLLKERENIWPSQVASFTFCNVFETRKVFSIRHLKLEFPKIPITQYRNDTQHNDAR
jgi:hypothetical protein